LNLIHNNGDRKTYSVMIYMSCKSNINELKVRKSSRERIQVYLGGPKQTKNKSILLRKKSVMCCEIEVILDTTQSNVSRALTRL